MLTMGVDMTLIPLCISGVSKHIVQVINCKGTSKENLHVIKSNKGSWHRKWKLKNRTVGNIRVTLFWSYFYKKWNYDVMFLGYKDILLMYYSGMYLGACNRKP